MEHRRRGECKVEPSGELSLNLGLFQWVSDGGGKRGEIEKSSQSRREGRPSRTVTGICDCELRGPRDPDKGARAVPITAPDGTSRLYDHFCFVTRSVRLKQKSGGTGQESRIACFRRMVPGQVEETDREKPMAIRVCEKGRVDRPLLSSGG